ncbi:MAG TPA: hypothetical protein VGH03_05370 [Caulobacteraceae bacterium]|jgi:hypothetical protein
MSCHLVKGLATIVRIRALCRALRKMVKPGYWRSMRFIALTLCDLVASAAAFRLR